MKIYLIRHGQSTGDIENRYGGAYDDELTDKGMLQAQELAGKLSDTGIQVFFCSPMKRALKTGEILKAKLNCELKIIENLKERNKNGIVTGMTKDEAKAKYPKLVEELKDYRNQIPGAESQDDFAKRIKKTIGEITDLTNYSTIGIVTHGMPFWVIFEEFLSNNEIVKVKDCGYAILDKEGQKFTLEITDGIIKST